jgi:hypothetical protein
VPPILLRDGFSNHFILKRGKSILPKQNPQTSLAELEAQFFENLRIFHETYTSYYDCLITIPIVQDNVKDLRSLIQGFDTLSQAFGNMSQSLPALCEAKGIVL